MFFFFSKCTKHFRVRTLIINGELLSYTKQCDGKTLLQQKIFICDTKSRRETLPPHTDVHHFVQLRCSWLFKHFILKTIKILCLSLFIFLFAKTVVGQDFQNFYNCCVQTFDSHETFSGLRN